MSKPEWGKKRACLQCSALFYDLQKSPIFCPKCGAEFDPELFFKKRSKSAAAETKIQDLIALETEDFAIEKESSEEEILADDEVMEDDNRDVPSLERVHE